VIRGKSRNSQQQFSKLMVSGRMMKDMTDIANILGAYLPGSNPRFMEPGLALHVTVRAQG